VNSLKIKKSVISYTLSAVALGVKEVQRSSKFCLKIKSTGGTLNSSAAIK
jgi:hypothetical protein